LKLGVSSVGPSGDGGPEYVLVEVPADGDEERKLIEMIGDRLMMGYKQYGRFSDPRKVGKDWVKETLEEILDSQIYIAKEILRIIKLRDLANALKPAGASLPNPSEVGREVHPVRPTEANGKKDGPLTLWQWRGGVADGEGEGDAGDGGR
jgi:hypothetical protein